MMTDPISDFLIQIKNAYMAGKRSLSVPHGKFKENIANLLVSEGYISSVMLKKKDKVKKDLYIQLLYKNKQPALEQVIMVSKPGSRVYLGKKDIKRVRSGYGKLLISTPAGVMTGEKARKKGLGGEAVCKIW